MGTSTAAEIDAFLRQGGVVVAASERAARAAAQRFHTLRRAEGLTAWPAPRITHWQAFVQGEWEARVTDRRLVLSAFQEFALWRNTMQQSKVGTNILPPSMRRLGRLAMSAHSLLNAYAPEYLAANQRRGWSEDAAVFSDWLASFDTFCRANDLVSVQRLPGELASFLRNDAELRAPLLLVGFDRILPSQQTLFDAWGDTRFQSPGIEDSRKSFYAAPDVRSEISACAEWAHRLLLENPARRLLVITQDIVKLRGQIERAFLERMRDISATFEFSLGVSLSSIPLVRSALLALDWMTESLTEAEVDWLIGSGYTSELPATTAALQAVMRRVRRQGLERPRWSLDAFCREASRADATASWRIRMFSARQMVDDTIRRSPLDWASQTKRILDTLAWPGARTLTSAEYQALESFAQQIEECASLGFDGRQMTWREFSTELHNLANEALFSTQSQGSSIVITGPSESAGLEADGIWFLGVTEDAWPARGESHPFLPAWLQRRASMPHAEAQLDFETARRITSRLAASAPKVCFSYAKQCEGIDTPPSRLAGQFTEQIEPLPQTHAAISQAQLVQRSDDVVEIALASPADGFHVDSATISAQSQCPFKAFATSRLAARGWKPAGVGLSASTRGKLLHDVMAAIWSGPPAGISDSDQLQAITDVEEFVAPHVADAMNGIAPEIRAPLPAAYLDLEEQRMTRLLCNWLAYERARAKFHVEFTERKVDTCISGLPLRLRLDRADRLSDGSLLVIDYKSGDVSPKLWDIPRPEDVQLPLYAAFGLPPEQTVGGVVFAKVRAGDTSLAGRVTEPQATIGLVENIATLRNKKLTPELLRDWQRSIERLAADFVSGHAEADPRELEKTCQRCGLQTICRVAQTALFDDEPEEEDA